jgi:hypothetical protein
MKWLLINSLLIFNQHILANTFTAKCSIAVNNVITDQVLFGENSLGKEFEIILRKTDRLETMKTDIYTGASLLKDRNGREFEIHIGYSISAAIPKWNIKASESFDIITIVNPDRVPDISSFSFGMNDGFQKGEVGFTQGQWVYQVNCKL